MWNDLKWCYLTRKVNAKDCDCFWMTQNRFESSNQKFQKSSSFDFESGYESGYGFASPLNIIKNDALDILLFK